MISLKIHIEGRVQRVGFRYFIYKEAIKLGVLGYIENNADGSVFIRAEGQREAMYNFLSYCRKGPKWSNVISCEITETTLDQFKKFEIRK